MKRFVVLTATALMSCYSVYGEAQPFNLTFVPGEIHKNCSNSKSASEAGRAIENVLTSFKEQSVRQSNPQAFVDAIDKAIAKTKLAPILKCRDILNSTRGFRYELRFQDPSQGNQSMRVVQEDEDSSGIHIQKRILEFNLVKPVSTVIFVYLHELTHVCQAPEVARLRSLLDEPSNEFEKRAGDVVRAKILGEIEAFYVMNLAFSEVSSQTSSICQERNLNGNLLSDVYQNSESAVLRGSFAQDIIYSYSQPGDESPFDYYARNIDYLVQRSSSEVSYLFTDDPANRFTLRHLDPALKDGIVKLGIPVNE